MGIVLVAFLAARIGHDPSRYHDDINLQTHQLRRLLRGPIRPPPPQIGTRWRCLSVYVATLAQSLPNCLHTGGRTGRIVGDRYPIRGTFFGCCADAEKQSAKSMAQRVRTMIFLIIFLSALSIVTPPDTRPSLRTSFRALCITRTEIKESVIYSGSDRDSLIQKPEGGLRLNCTDASSGSRRIDSYQTSLISTLTKTFRRRF